MWIDQVDKWWIYWEWKRIYRAPWWNFLGLSAYSGLLQAKSVLRNFLVTLQIRAEIYIQQQEDLLITLLNQFNCHLFIFLSLSCWFYLVLANIFVHLDQPTNYTHFRNFITRWFCVVIVHVLYVRQEILDYIITNILPNYQSQWQCDNHPNNCLRCFFFITWGRGFFAIT